MGSGYRTQTKNPENGMCVRCVELGVSAENMEQIQMELNMSKSFHGLTAQTVAQEWMVNHELYLAVLCYQLPAVDNHCSVASASVGRTVNHEQV